MHAEETLDQVGRWLATYHRVVADFVPAAGSRWREGRSWSPGMVVGHGDPAPYNAVWGAAGLVGFVDWDNAGPWSVEEDLAWVAFSWTPLHARAIVVGEGFSDFGARRRRLERLLAAYGWGGTTQDALTAVERRIVLQVETVRRTAAAGDAAYRRMLDHGLDRALEDARSDLVTV